MKLLLENGGNPNLENFYGITPIMLQYDYETIRKSLKEIKESPKILDTPIGFDGSIKDR